jgi:hypothetical protein
MSRSLPALVILLLSAQACLGQSAPAASAADPQASDGAESCSLGASPFVSAEAAAHRSDSDSAEELSARLAAAYNQQARAVHSVVAALQLVATPGPSYGDQAKHTQGVDALVSAQSPESIRLIGSVPFAGMTLFDLASDGKRFSMMIPPRHVLLVGANEVGARSPKAIENIRPQHLLDALLWPERTSVGQTALDASAPLDPLTYRLKVMAPAVGGALPITERVIALERRTLLIAQIDLYGADGALVSEVRYADWLPTSPGAGSDAAVCFPRHIWIHRPLEDYSLEILVTRVTLNEPLQPQRFFLQPRSGMQVIDLDSNAAGKH